MVIMMSKKVVIFKEFGEYKMATVDVYYEHMLNMSAITKIENVNNYEEAKGAVQLWLNLDEKHIINKTGE